MLQTQQPKREKRENEVQKSELAKKGIGSRKGKTAACNGEHMKYVNGAFTLVNAKRSKELFSLS